jgi:hypothetical protein
MSRIGRASLAVVCGTTVLVMVSCATSISLREPARRNQIAVADLLLKARLDLSGPSSVSRVRFPDGTLLVPDRDEIVRGYVLRARVESGHFTISAQPMKPEAGYMSFFRDEAGSLREEVSPITAGPGSPPVGGTTEPEDGTGLAGRPH